MARNISVNQMHFARIPTANIRRSVFDRSHVYKTTFNEGRLIPYFVDEVLPGDTFSLDSTEFCRLATPIAPIMDNLYLETFFFFIPYRLVWDHWVNMCGERDNPEDSTDYTVPFTHYVDLTDDTGTILDYMGIGTAHFGSGSGDVNDHEDIDLNALPFRAYWLVWNEWFRDENLQKSVKINKSDASGKAAVFELMGAGSPNPDYDVPAGHEKQAWWTPAPRGKRYDYFTSCLPWPQKGPGVEIPLTGDAQIYYNPVNSPQVEDVPTVLNHSSGVQNYLTSGEHSAIYLSSGLPDSGNPTPLFADLSRVQSATINSLRQAFMLQRYYEIDARGGTRYTEKLVAHFGVTNPDSRLQRSEYLGGHSSMFNISPIAQTSSTDSTSPQGNLAALGICGRSYHAFTKSFSEFGVIIGLVNVRADLTYQQGINKMWLRRDVLDYYWPSFANLGEQVVTNAEIYAQGTAVDNQVFGYQERFAEYRYKPSLITGQMRSMVKDTLDVWHLSQEFASLPKLSDSFIQDHPPVSRVVAVPSQPHFLLDVKFNLKCVRPLPMFGIPGNTPHF